MIKNSFTEKSVWRQLLRLHQIAPVVFRTIVLLMIFELLGSVIGPMMIPDQWYLSWYLPERAKRKAKQFLDGNHLLIPDDNAGWRNRPGLKRGNWVIDLHGSRSTNNFESMHGKALRVLFLGSSMINGGTNIRNNETISAYLEDKEIESMNFGTMLYSLDQAFLIYRSQLHTYHANVIVVGLDVNSVAGLKNLYIPFRFPEETNMPFLKPRFKLSGKSLELITVQASAMIFDLLRNNRGIKFLADNDEFYYMFETYKRMGLTPIASSIRFAYLKFQRLKEFLVKDTLGFQLLKQLMKAMVNEAKIHKARVIFVILPNERALSDSKPWGILPDLYQKNVNEISSWGFDVMDVRSILRESKKSSRDLFAEDREHYTPMANHLIADAIRRLIKEGPTAQKG